MPSKQVHLKQAEHNQALIDELFALTDDFSDWITTAAFYKALHLIEALFTQDPEIRHTTTHADRYARLKTNPRYSHIYQNYRPLSGAADVARYLQTENGTTYQSFSQYLGKEKVRSEIIDNQLKQIEKSVMKFLTRKAKKPARK